MPPSDSFLLPGAPDSIHYRESRRVTWISVLINVILTIIQIVVGLLAQAQSLVADGFHSLSDLISDFMVLLANHHSRHPADDSHPYGHYRIETAMSLALGLLLTGTGAAILWMAGVRLQGSLTTTIDPIALWIALLTLVIKEALFRYMLAIAEKLRSPLLIANAWHSRSDAASSLVVAIGLGGNLLGYRFLDQVAAIIIGFMIARMGFRFIHESMRELVDTALSDEDVEQIRDTLRKTPGVLGLHNLRTRRMAHRVLADAHIQVDARISVSEGHHIAETARQRVLDGYPNVLDVLVHVDAEEDFPKNLQRITPQPGTYPERAVLLAHLQHLLGTGYDDTLFEKVLLHYLNHRVEAEIFLIPEAIRDTVWLEQAQRRLAERLPDDPYFSVISLNHHIAP